MTLRNVDNFVYLHRFESKSVYVFGTEQMPEEYFLPALWPGVLHSQFLLQTPASCIRTDFLPLPLCFNMTQVETARLVGSRMN
jgi:hypothetical protein